MLNIIEQFFDMLHPNFCEEQENEENFIFDTIEAFIAEIYPNHYESL